MTKGIKYLARKRKTAGLATGNVVCRISLPALNETFDRWFGFAYPDGVHVRKLARLRRFVRAQLPHAEAALEGAKVIVDASIRKANGALRRKQLAKWEAGQSIDEFLDSADSAWLQLPKEVGWSVTEMVEIPAPRGSAKRRRATKRTRPIS